MRASWTCDACSSPRTRSRAAAKRASRSSPTRASSRATGESSGFSDEGGNADSLCLVADADIDGDGASEWRALFTGDAERDQLRALIDEGLVDSVDLYKVGHHGSKNALDDEEAAVLSPRIALVSAGARNRYGHPAQDTLDRLEAAGARVFRTDEQGDVSCKLTADRIEVDTLR